MTAELTAGPLDALAVGPLSTSDEADDDAAGGSSEPQAASPVSAAIAVRQAVPRRQRIRMSFDKEGLLVRALYVRQSYSVAQGLPFE
ncbi:MAG: hypothetical protein ACT4PW_10855 [Acidimicrobiia bacterium]